MRNARMKSVHVKLAPEFIKWMDDEFRQTLTDGAAIRYLLELGCAVLAVTDLSGPLSSVLQSRTHRKGTCSIAGCDGEILASGLNLTLGTLGLRRR
jgi:hypothetical protein